LQRATNMTRPLLDQIITPAAAGGTACADQG
jgi:hypothetical protein